jgi:hypothetical protein
MLRHDPVSNRQAETGSAVACVATTVELSGDVLQLILCNSTPAVSHFENHFVVTRSSANLQLLFGSGMADRVVNQIIQHQPNRTGVAGNMRKARRHIDPNRELSFSDMQRKAL